MMASEPVQDDLQAAIDDGLVLIRVIGRGSFKISSTLKQFVLETTTERAIHTVAIDMQQCIGMDSTFMGVLAGLACQLKTRGETLELINLSEKNKELLSTLGVDQVVCHYDDWHGHPSDPGDRAPLATGQSSRKDLAETALQAHQQLVRINEENRPRFKKVIEYLRADIDRLNE